MSWSFKLFRIKGIDIKIHLTFVLILAWAAYQWGIATGAGLSGALFGIVFTLLLFAFVTLHEIFHSLTAMHYGVKVRDITLLPIGGVSQMEEMPEKPGQELRVAVVGPLTNLVVAFVLLAVLVLTGDNSVTSLNQFTQLLGSAKWEALPVYLVAANLALGIFNLIPAFPMDGGRVLRALLAFRMDYAKATGWAVRIGQGFAWLLGLYGILTGAWTLAVIGIFIYFGASQEGRAVQVKSIMGQIQVQQAMTRQFQTLSPSAHLSDVVSLIMQTFQCDFPVMEGDRMVGLLTETDVVAALHDHGPSFGVSQVMRKDFPTATPDQGLFEAQQRMAAARLRAMPVMAGNKLVGLLTNEDVNEAYWILPPSPGSKNV